MLAIYLYKDAKGEFRWRIKRKGRVLADSGEGYKTKAGAKRTLLRMIESMAVARYKFHEELV